MAYSCGFGLSRNLEFPEFLQKVLKHQLQTFLDDKCDAFFRLPMPERLYCFYDGAGLNDVFVFENLLADGFENFKNTDFDEQVKARLDHWFKYVHLQQISSLNFD